MTALPMTGFHRAQISLHENNPLEIQLLFKSYLSLAEKADSFRVRDSHPIPLFSEQECVSDCSGRAFATKATMLFSFLYARLILSTQKDFSCPAKCQTKEVLIS